MRFIRTRGRSFAFLIMLIVLLADRITKFAVLESAYLAGGNDITVLRGLISLSFVWNRGAAFSVLMEHPVWLTVITSVILLILSAAVYLPERVDAVSRLSLSMVLGGGLGNLTDRILHGAVVDFIRLDFINFPIFNAADIAVTVGVILFGIGSFLPIGRKENGK